MVRYIFAYGGIAGVIVITTMTLGIILARNLGVGSGSAAFGYLVMLVTLSLIFVAVKKYRDTERGGVISFGRGFGLGAGIAAVAGVAYVIGWELYLAISGVDFIGEYANGVIEKKKAAGISPADLAAITTEMETLKQNYANPLFRLPMTFVEIFPIGLVIAAISGFILRHPKGKTPKT